MEQTARALRQIHTGKRKWINPPSSLGNDYHLCLGQQQFCGGWNQLHMKTWYSIANLLYQNHSLTGGVDSLNCRRFVWLDCCCMVWEAKQISHDVELGQGDMLDWVLESEPAGDSCLQFQLDVCFPFCWQLHWRATCSIMSGPVILHLSSRGHWRAFPPQLLPENPPDPHGTFPLALSFSVSSLFFQFVSYIHLFDLSPFVLLVWNNNLLDHLLPLICLTKLTWRLHHHPQYCVSKFIYFEYISVILLWVWMFWDWLIINWVVFC